MIAAGEIGLELAAERQVTLGEAVQEEYARGVRLSFLGDQQRNSA